MTDLRDLCARMADELDRYRQLLMDDRREVHALATEARAALAEPEPEGPTDEVVTKLSPAAQAAYDGFWRGQGYFEGDEFGACLAAAFRAAVTAVGSEEMFHPNSKRTEGVKWCVQRIYAIADELEVQ